MHVFVKCLNARMSLAWVALWQLPFPGMTYFGCVLDLSMPRRRCCQHPLAGMSPLLLPRLLLSRSPSNLLLPWADIFLAHEVAVLGSCRSVPAYNVVCRVHPPAAVRVYVGTRSTACLVFRPLVVDLPTVLFSCCCRHVAPACA